MRLDRPPVASKGGVPLGSASLFVDELTGSDDDLMVEGLCHGARFVSVDCGVHMDSWAGFRSCHDSIEPDGRWES